MIKSILNYGFWLFLAVLLIHASVKAEGINFNNMTQLRCDTTFKVKNNSGNTKTYTERFRLYLDDTNKTMHFEDKTPFNISVYNDELISADRNVKNGNLHKDVHYEITRDTGKIKIEGHIYHQNNSANNKLSYEGAGDCSASSD